ncbi:MAG TPA: ABC transporter permease [Vicinamibacterales bacterium]|nr:ABC transporter permease [Vicinamibacterales bacterium]
MRVLRILGQRLRALVRREAVTGEIHDELQHHVDLLAERLEKDGRRPDEARREARRRVGNLGSLQDAGYDVRGGGRLDEVWHDVRYAFRLLQRHPAFALVAVLTLGLGIGATTAIFSVANGILLRPLPYPDADRLAMVWMDNARIGLAEDWHSFPNIQDYRDGSATFDHLAVFNRAGGTLTGVGEPERLTGAHSTANLFDVLGVRPALGRAYTDAENEAGNDAVIVLSHSLWQRSFGGRDDVLDQTIELSGRQRRIIGVMPESFAFPARDTAFWVPTALNENNRVSRNSLWLQAIGRLKADVSVLQAQADLARVNAGILEAFPQQKGYGIYVVGYHDQIVGAVRPAVLVLAGAVAFVLLIACANVANLLLARASTREREVALRSAIGAGRGRIVRQLLTESVVLGSVGGLVGLGLAWLLLRTLIGLAPATLPRLDAIGIDGRLVLFSAAVSMLTGILFGLAPALQTAGVDPGRSLKDGGRGSTGVGGRLRAALVVGEVALAVVLLVGAGLMVRSFQRIQQVDMGFDTTGVLTARVTLAGARYQEAPAVVDFYTSLIERTAADPSIEGAAGIGTVLLSATPNSTNFSIEGRPDFAPDEAVEVPVDSITPNYFAVMRVPLVRGRFFDARDSSAAASVVIINQTMARMFFADEDPVGKRIKYGQLASNAPWMTIVGVVADTRRTGYDAAVRPETYLPHAQSTTGSLQIVVRTTGDPTRAAPALRGAARVLDPLVPLSAVGPLEDELGELTAQRRLNTVLLSVFGVLATLLAAVGIYGVLAYSVQQRTRELGVRLALGASASGILALVLREGLLLSGLGLIIGLAGAVALSRTLTSMLYDVGATDPATYLAIAGLTVGVGLVACGIPAVRALRVDPVVALRGE